jgi:hypothetical protein
MGILPATVLFSLLSLYCLVLSCLVIEGERSVPTATVKSLATKRSDSKKLKYTRGLWFSFPQNPLVYFIFAMTPFPCVLISLACGCVVQAVIRKE